MCRTVEIVIAQRALLSYVLVMFLTIDRETTGYVDPDMRRGRGANSNRSGRYDLAKERVSDGWEMAEDTAPFQTEVSMEMARRIITFNRSPDLPFDRSINPYRGCEHGCVYCFARPTHSYLGLSPGLDFETRLIARPMAASLLARELSSPRYTPAPMALGTNTDPYQPIEKKHQITRECLKVLLEFQHPVAIVTKGTLVERDIDIIAELAGLGLARVGISLTTLDPELSRKMEPRAPSPQRRLSMIRRLTRAGIPVRVMTSPLIPGLTDHELETMLEAGKAAGADVASWIMLRLPAEVSDLWQDWLVENVPNRANRIMARLREMHGGRDYDARWGRRMRGEGPYADMIAKRFNIATRRLGLSQRSEPLRCDLFRVPIKVGDQLSLF